MPYSIRQRLLVFLLVLTITGWSIIALSSYAKDMAENMYRALWSWTICVIVTIVVSLVTKPKPHNELEGLVYGLTKIPSEGDYPFYKRSIFWAGVVFVIFIVVNIIFW